MFLPVRLKSREEWVTGQLKCFIFDVSLAYNHDYLVQ